MPHLGQEKIDGIDAWDDKMKATAQARLDAVKAVSKGKGKGNVDNPSKQPTVTIQA